MTLQGKIYVAISQNVRLVSLGLLMICAGVLAGCTEIKRPVPEPFFAETAPPPKQEFRWSNGKSPKSFDPARASAAPETDIVRALFEGLTEIDPVSLSVVPAVAEKWSSTDDAKTWTFELRNDARWSNGKPVTADDFVSSWKRLKDLGDKTAHRELFQNIVGLQTPKPVSSPTPTASPDIFRTVPEREPAIHEALPSVSLKPSKPQTTASTLPPEKNIKESAKTTISTEKIGVIALDKNTLKVELLKSDKDFPELVANPIFRPIWGDGVEFESDPLDTTVVTNGPFTVADADKNGVTLDRSESYWNKASVSLDQVHFVPMANAEAALNAYKNGDIDAVTNAEFAPLALKLLAPYNDFRQTTHSALNYYQFNTNREPFNDRRVREALAISIDRQKLTEGELEGSTQPANSFLPLGDKKHARINLDIEKAKDLLDKAGYPDGEGFPAIQLLINRNDTQQRVARTVAKMWKQNLNLDTEITVKEAAEMQDAQNLLGYDLVRRGVVLPTLDEGVSMAAINADSILHADVQSKAAGPVDSSSATSGVSELPTPVPFATDPDETDEAIPDDKDMAVSPGHLTEGAAVFDLTSIPLYFPLSYSLVKPYVSGFDTNGLDAPLLQKIRIDNNWQTKQTKNAS